MSSTRRRGSSIGLAFLVSLLCLGAGRTLDAAVPVQGASPAISVADDGNAAFLGSPAGRFWLRTDYLAWWTSGVELPPLVTTSPQGTPAGQAGVLPGATVLYGDQAVGNDCRSGFRTTFGMWLDAGHVWDVEVDYLWLGEQITGFSQTSAGDPILARPFFNAQTGLQASQRVAYPGQIAGTISVDAQDQFQSLGVLVGYNLFCANSCNRRTDLLVGFRHYNLGDRLDVVEYASVTAPGPTQNTTYLFRDHFYANNDFYGPDLGIRTRLYRGRWSLEILTKIALGNTHRSVTIDGQTVVTAPNQLTQSHNGGILAVGTNSGHYQDDRFTMIPQLGLELGCQVNRNWRVYAGYSLLYWASVARAADQIDLNVDPRNFPPPLAGAVPFPTFPERTSGFWAQGMNVGAEFRF